MSIVHIDFLILQLSREADRVDEPAGGEPYYGVQYSDRGQPGELQGVSL